MVEFAKKISVVKFIKVGLVRWSGMAFGLLATIKLAGVFGPAKMGVSGMISVSLLQVTLLIESLTAAYERDWKVGSKSKRELIVLALWGKLFVSTFLALIWAAFALFFLDYQWKLCALLAVPQIIFSIPTWYYLVEENQVVFFALTTVQSLLLLLIYHLCLTVHTAAGVDLLSQGLIGMMLYILVWRHILSQYPSESGMNVLTILKDFRNYWWSNHKMIIFGIAGYFCLYIDTPIINYLVGKETLGYYRVANYVAAGAFSAVGFIGMLIYPKVLGLASLSGHAFTQKVDGYFIRMLALGVGCSVLYAIAAPVVFKLAWGDVYLISIWPSVFLFVAKLLNLSSNVYGWALVAKGHEGKSTISLLISAACSAVGCFTLVPHFGIIGAAVSVLGSALVSIAIGRWMIMKSIPKSEAI